jgi:hypothetical protein
MHQEPGRDVKCRLLTSALIRDTTMKKVEAMRYRLSLAFARATAAKAAHIDGEGRSYKPSARH